MFHYFSFCCQINYFIPLFFFHSVVATDFPDAEKVNVTFLSGATNAAISLTLLSDDIAEKDEVFVAVLESSDTNCAIVVQILDDDGKFTTYSSFLYFVASMKHKKKTRLP